MKLKNYLLLPLLLAISIFSLNAVDQESDGEKLVEAAQGQDWNAVNKLLANPGIDVNVRGKYGDTALILASLRGRVEVVRLLLDQENIDVNAIGDEYGNTALMWASEREHEVVVKLLLANPDIDVNAIDYADGHTALMWASIRGHAEIVRLLLEAGAKTEIKNKNDKTALVIAEQRNYHEIINLLREKEEVQGVATGGPQYEGTALSVKTPESKSPSPASGGQVKTPKKDPTPGDEETTNDSEDGDGDIISSAYREPGKPVKTPTVKNPKKGSTASVDESILTLSNAVIVLVVASVCVALFFTVRHTMASRRAKNKKPNSTPDRAQKQTS